MSNAQDDLEIVSRAVQIHSATSFDIDGLHHEIEDKRAEDKDAAVLELRDALYRFYSRQWTAGSRFFYDRLGVSQFVERLSKANTGSGTWDPGWRVVRLDQDGRFEVMKDGLSVWVRPEGILSSRGVLEPESCVYIRIGKEMRARSPGFYLAIGEAAQPERPAEIITRLYWHLTAEIAERAVGLLTHTLNGLRVPFRFKVVSNPQGFTRADTGVLYLDRNDYQTICSTFRALYRTLAPSLLPEVPWFTKPLGRGLSVAEDPQNGESFGQHRCRLIAESLWTAWRDDDQKLHAVRNVFSQMGLDPDRPYLGPGSRDTYAPLDDGL